MAKQGIRAFVNALFVANLSTLAEVGGKAFRRTILDTTAEQFGISVNSAATHYNFAFKTQKQADPKSVEGLGRPEGKNNGGRKPVHVVTVVKAKSGDVVAEGISRAKADQMIATAIAKKKAKLMILVPETATTADVSNAEVATA